MQNAMKVFKVVQNLCIFYLCTYRQQLLDAKIKNKNRMTLEFPGGFTVDNGKSSRKRKVV